VREDERRRYAGGLRKGVLAALVWALLVPGPVQGRQISHYIHKYKTIELSSVQMKRIAEYDRLIVAFSSIAFIRPGYKVNPDFIRALMLTESGGDPNAVSPKNALGLCQLLYPTAQAAARELLTLGITFRHIPSKRLRSLQPEDLFDPAINILLTCYLVAKYNFLYDGRLDLVVAAWNAGEGAIVDNRPPDYPETLDLIGKVNGYLHALFRERRGRLMG